MGEILSEHSCRREIMRGALLLALTAAAVSGGAGTVRCARCTHASALSFVRTETLRGLGKRVDDAIAAAKDTAAPGAIGRCMAVLALHPLDTLKTRVQVVSSARRRTAVAAIYRAPGVFAGSSPSVVGQVISAVLTCVGYEFWKGWSRDFAPDMDARSRTILCAVMGDATGSLILAPAEVAKTQLQTRVQRDPPSVLRWGMRRAPRTWLLGYSALLLREVPYRALQISFFDELARGYMAHTNVQHLSLSEVLGTGVAAGCAAAAITAPLDVARSRLMHASKQHPAQVLLSALRFDGSGSLAGSLMPRILHVGCSTALFFAVYERATKILCKPTSSWPSDTKSS